MVVFRTDNDKDKFTEIYRLSIAKGVNASMSDSTNTILHQCKLFCAESIAQIKVHITPHTNSIKIFFIKEFYNFFRYNDEYGGTTRIFSLTESKIIVDYLMGCGLFIIIEKNDAVVLLNKGFIFEGLLQ